ncbi:hypothetical protein SEEE0816_15277, partial [Salmonella enterica subsp. enterica serovar Enteritidis str. 607308-16]
LPLRILSPLSTVPYISLYGKDEKLRLRFDSSVSEKALPQATTRRAKRAALSHPSPTTITPSRILSPLSIVSHISLYGKDEKLRLRFDSSESEKALPQATTRRAKRAALSHPSPTTMTS